MKANNETDPKLALIESLTRRRSKLLDQPKTFLAFKTFGHKNVISFAFLKVNETELRVLLTSLESDFLKNSLLLLF